MTVHDWIAAVALATGVAVPALAQGVVYDSSAQSWTLTSGPVSYRLVRRGEQVVFDYFGPTSTMTAVPSESASAPRYDLAGLADGEALAPPSLRLVSQSTRSLGAG